MAAVPVILVCDDDPDDQVLLKEAFSQAGIQAEFRFTNDGLELIDYLEHSNGNREYPSPKIILLDLNMPRMNGKQALEWIKSHSKFKAIPVVIYTTSNETIDVRQCYRLGANTFMTKCARFDELVAKANTFAKYWMDVAKLP